MRIRGVAPRGQVLLWAALSVLAAGPRAALSQVVWEDLVITGGVSGEGYEGNLSAVTISAVDSTDNAAAAVGEFGVRGAVLLFGRETRALRAEFDAGLRQFAAAGFELRDYAPREWVGSLDLSFDQAVGEVGVIQAAGRVKGRWVEDRPPMPLFIQPGYGELSGSLSFRTRSLQGVRFDARLTGRLTDYRALEFAPQLDLLDRRAAGVEVGAQLGESGPIRFFVGYEGSSYREQGSFDPTDPFRRDNTVRAGAQWSSRSPVIVQIGVEGALNRSNSRRPEYNAISTRALVSAPLPGEFGLTLFAQLTGKSYLSDTEFARLVPGEEADNASQAFLSLDRPLAVNLDGALRLGWTRAETDIGDSYFQRFGATFLLHFRPGLP